MIFENLNNDLAHLVESGYVKLPSIEHCTWRKDIYERCLGDMDGKNYGENLDANIEFLHQTEIISRLVPALVILAEQHFGKKVDSGDIYNVCRLVRAGEIHEGYRGHFDSHLFTMVTPILIPDVGSENNNGQLHFYPNARSQPKTELSNIIGKVYFKKYNSERGFRELSQHTRCFIESFIDYRPLLFIGNTTFHGNAYNHTSTNENRMTLLTHFFDPSSSFGVGKALRMLRRR